ncbi:MAG: HRDC domain-containing protein [Alkalispirochaetaceae bacterium]
MESYRVISTDKGFRSWYESIPRDQRALAIDLEAEFNLHIYGEHFCLLQVYDGREAVAIDPYQVSIDLIKALLEDRERLKITYDSASDRLLLYKNHGILMNTILDLRPAVDILEFQKQGLSSVLEEVLSLPPSGEKKKFQQYNWTKRPIDPGALAYAIEDVFHLYRLRDALIHRIVEAGLLDRYLVENFRLQAAVPETERKPGMLRGGRFRRLEPAQQALLEELHAVREEVAREVNLPPNTVYPNTELFNLATGRGAPRDARRSRPVPERAFEKLLARLEEIAFRR